MRGALAFLAVALCGLVSGAAQAQLSCTPSVPRTDPGTGFEPFGAAEQLVARGGNAGPAWEWAIGTDTEGSQSAKGSLDWVSGKLYSWTLSYSGASAATIEVRDSDTLVLSRTWPSGMDTGNALQVQVSTNPSIGPGTTMSASVSSINGHALSGAVSQTGNNTQAEQNLYWFFPPMASGFTAQGTVSLIYGSLPAGARVQFLARAGSIACSGGNAAPTVSITSPAANATFTAPASIALAANAQDSDGTVTQVQYFANASPIGTATTSPYSFTWTNVPAGAYSLTAVATDNSGAVTTSTRVSITVGVAQAKLYFIHTDHLNTPRLISDDQQRTVWRWDNTDPFGGNPPDENPSGLGVFEFPLRFPGQYFDKETNLNYNYFRDYDSSVGRYLQSDPIGVASGLNTYLYGRASPMLYLDPDGLQVAPPTGGVIIGGSSATAGGAIGSSAAATGQVGSNANIARGLTNLLNQITASSSVPLPPTATEPVPSSCPIPPAANDPGADDCLARQQALLGTYYGILNMQARGINVLRNVYLWYNQQAVIHNIVCRQYKVPVFNIGPIGMVK